MVLFLIYNRWVNIFLRMNTKDKIAQARERIKELEVMIDVWESTLPKKKFGDNSLFFKVCENEFLK